MEKWRKENKIYKIYDKEKEREKSKNEMSQPESTLHIFKLIREKFPVRRIIISLKLPYLGQQNTHTQFKSSP